MYRLELSHTAHQQIRRLQKQTQERVNDAIAGLADNPRPPGNRKLAGRDGYRIRVGDYRILYHIDDDQQLVTIYRVGPRENVYRF